MSSNSPTIVTLSDTAAADAGLTRVEAGSVEELLEAVGSADDTGTLLVAPDPVAADFDTFVAIVSVLVVDGVQYFETTQPRAVKRILDTHGAIVRGAIEPIGS